MIEPTCGSDLEALQRPGAEVEPVDVARAERGPRARRDRDGAQHRRLARRRWCRRRACEPSRSGSKYTGLLQLPLGDVAHAEQDRAVASGRQRRAGRPSVARSSSHGRRGAGMPATSPRRRAWRRCASGRSGPRSPSCASVSAPASDLPPRGRPNRSSATSTCGGSGSSLRPAARVGGLERHEPARAGLGDAAAGDATGRSAPATGSPTTSFESRLVRHAQRDAQVGVGAQVVLDDARRALRRHDQVDAERPAALGDVDDAVDELGHLARERGELVDDEHERRRGVGVAAASRARAGPWPSCG